MRLEAFPPLVSRRSQVALQGEDVPEESAIGSTGAFLYGSTILFSTDTLTVLSISLTTGALTSIGGSPFSGWPFSGGLAVTPDSKFLYLTNQEPDGVNGVRARREHRSPVGRGSPFAPPKASQLPPAGMSKDGIVIHPAGGLLRK